MAALRQTQYETPSPDPRFELARLALLHDEARETALLANLLGRTPYAAAALAIASLFAVLAGLGAMPAAEPAIWMILSLIGIGAMARIYARAIERPFERASLREFSSDVRAAIVYAGFAWGAGAFLVLSPETGPIGLLLYMLAAPVVVACTLRERELALGFLAPAATLCAFATVLRPLPDGPLAAAFVVIAAGLAACAIFWGERLLAPHAAPAKLPELPLLQP